LRAERYQKPLALLLADIDDFKIFNDTLGHLQGDQVLKVVSNVLTAQLRRVDLLARFGGDEFAVIMPDTDQAGAEAASSRIQKAVSQQRYADRQLGLSIGVAVFQPGMSPVQLVELSDRELYRSKSTKSLKKLLAVE
jgi:diguanylate cyclase (GGDEF)-like protein